VLAAGLGPLLFFAMAAARGLAACPRDWAGEAALLESGAAGSAFATAHATLEPAPATTPATATPRQSSLTLFMVFP